VHIATVSEKKNGAIPMSSGVIAQFLLWHDSSNGRRGRQGRTVFISFPVFPEMAANES
jgi:hypothetical protein